MPKSKLRRELIIREAINVFREKRFDNGSISEIARRLGVRSSLIYYYFKNKDEIFTEIVKFFTEELCREIANVIKADKSPKDNLFSVLYAYKNYIRDHRALYDIFREVEFVKKDFALDFYDRLTSNIAAIIRPLIKDDIDLEAVAYSILGSIYFVIIKNLIWDNKEDVNKELEVVQFVLERGIDRIGDFVPYIIPKKKVPEPEEMFETKGEKTRHSLIKAAEKLFGERGYNETQISDIAYHAKVGLGTFYIYFKSKKEALVDVIHYVNRELRRNSWFYFKDFSDRRDIENAGIQAFFYQFQTMGNDYRIVREAEFVDKEIGVWYYTRIGSAYARGLSEGMKSGEIVNVDPETLALILMGISHTVGIKWFVLEERRDIDEKSVLSVLEFIMHGLKGIERR